MTRCDRVVEKTFFFLRVQSYVVVQNSDENFFQRQTRRYKFNKLFGSGECPIDFIGIDLLHLVSRPLFLPRVFFICCTEKTEEMFINALSCDKFPRKRKTRTSLLTGAYGSSPRLFVGSVAL